MSNHMPYRLLKLPSAAAGGAAMQANDAVRLVAFWPRFLTPEQCRAVVALSRGYEEFQGSIGAGDSMQVRDDIRDSRVRFIMPDAGSEWLFNKLEQGLLHLNRGYQFDLRGFFQGAQVATYAPGGHYDWHMDVGSGSYSNRKLSMSIQLSDAADYDGGDLEFMAATDQPTPRDIGTLVVFPSFLVHRVAPVTRGRRVSLVSWISGPAFR